MYGHAVLTRHSLSIHLSRSHDESQGVCPCEGQGRDAPHVQIPLQRLGLVGGLDPCLFPDLLDRGVHPCHRHLVWAYHYRRVTLQRRTTRISQLQGRRESMIIQLQGRRKSMISQLQGRRKTMTSQLQGRRKTTISQLQGRRKNND